MRKLSTLILGLMVAGSLYAQRPDGVIVKATTPPLIDGVIDDVWTGANAYNIERKFKLELPTLGSPGETTWKMLWDNTGLFVMLNVTDDAFLPAYTLQGAADWAYDKPELYFDCNANLEEGDGPGHYQFAFAFEAGKIDGTPITESNGIVRAAKVTGNNYVFEYFFPIGTLKDKSNATVNLAGTVGFDVTIIDRDPDDAARKRAVWANDGTQGSKLGTSRFYMDQSGKITFAGFENIPIQSIALTGGSITKDNETMQVVASILPENATIKDLKWSVATKEGSSGRAYIDSKGVLTPILNGIVTVTATATDGSNIKGSVDVTISGQTVTRDDISYIKNGDFSGVDTNGAPTVWQGFEAGTALVVDGVLGFAPSTVTPNIFG